MVAPFIGDPLSECSVKSFPAPPSRKYVLRNAREACSVDSVSYTSQPDNLAAENIHNQVEIEKEPLKS